MKNDIDLFFYYFLSFPISLRCHWCRGPVSYLRHMCVTRPRRVTLWHFMQEPGGGGWWVGGGSGGGRRRGSHWAEEKGHLAVSSFRCGLHVEMNLSIASHPSTAAAVDDDDSEAHSLISPPRSHQACFITREVKLSDCVAAAAIFFLVPLCIYYSSARLDRSARAISLRWPLRREHGTWSGSGNTKSNF